MSYYATAHQAAAMRMAGESWDAICAWTGWRRNSAQSIVCRALKGQLRLPGTLPKGRWSKEMDLLLIKYWEKENGHQLADRLSPLAGRRLTLLAVNARANRLGLEKPGARWEWHSKHMEARSP